MTNNTVCILAVEDESINQMVLKMFLGANSKVVGTGTEALETIERYHNDINIIFMDIGLPDMDGIKVAQQIRAYETKNKLKPIYICALTAHNNPEKKQACLAAGMNAFLTKPVSPEQITEILAKAPNE